jgi:hypothetical protein
MAAINQALRLYEDTYTTDKYSSVDYLSQGKLTANSVLSSAVVHLFGQRSNRFPLLLATKAKGAVVSIESVDTLFTVPIMGKPKKTSLIVATPYSAGSKIGVGKTPITITFADKHFRKGETLALNSGILLTVQEEPKAGDLGFDYVLKIHGSNNNAYVPYTDLKAGTRLAGMFVAAGLKNSKGTESRTQMPSKMQNQCTKLRATYNWVGNLKDKVMVIELPAGEGRTTKVWQEWEMYDHDLRFMEEQENALWYSQFNRTADGKILDKDVNTGDLVITGSGLLEQIPNETTYGILTENIIYRTVRDVLYNSCADKVKQISIYTGVGGREEFHRAFASSLGKLGYTNFTTQFVGGEANSNNLTYGAYFGTYKHQDGHVVTLKMLPLLDHGAKADAAPKHPTSGLPITSYDMYFIDESTVDGKPNLQFVQEKGAEDIRKKINGMNGDSDIVSSDDMTSSVQYVKSVGIHMYNPVSSFKLRCIAA